MFDIKKNYALVEKLYSIIKVLNYYCKDNQDTYEMVITSRVLEEIIVLADTLYVEFIEEAENLNLID